MEYRLQGGFAFRGGPTRLKAVLHASLFTITGPPQRKVVKCITIEI